MIDIYSENCYIVHLYIVIPENSLYCGLLNNVVFKIAGNIRTIV